MEDSAGLINSAWISSILATQSSITLAFAGSMATRMLVSAIPVI
jgi:hypothetical protein